MTKRSEEQHQQRIAFIRSACQAILEDGAPPRSAKQVREKMKQLRPQEICGDQNLINEIYLAWISDHEAGRVADLNRLELSNALEHAIRTEIRAQTDKMRVECDARLDGALADVQDLLGLNSQLEERVNDLETELAARTSERDEAVGALAECRSHLESTETAVAEMRARQEAAALQLATLSAERTDLDERRLAAENAATAALATAERLRLDLHLALSAAQDAADRAAAAEAAAEKLRSTPRRSAIRPGHNVASRSQRLSQAALTPLR